MRSVETQKRNLKLARCDAYDISQVIHFSEYSQEDKRTMLDIINATYDCDAWEIYKNADTMVKDALQRIIEEKYFGSKTDAQEVRYCPKCGCAYKERPAVSREIDKAEICPACGTREAIATLMKNTLAR